MREEIWSFCFVYRGRGIKQDGTDEEAGKGGGLLV